jgi:CBS domain containing-hemolysin-like protein
MIFIILSIIILFLGFGFIAFEIAYLSVSYPIIFKSTNRKEFIENPVGILFTILFGVNVLSIVYAIISFRFFKEFFNEDLSIVFGGIFSTITFVLFSEFAPRIISRLNPSIILRIFKWQILLTYYLILPINLILKFFSPKNPEEIIKLYLDELERKQIVDKFEKEVIKRIFDYLKMEVKNFVRKFEDFDIVSLNELENIRNFKSDIIIVKDGEKILGYIYKKQLLKIDEIEIYDLINKPVFMSDNSKLEDVIKEMKNKRVSVIFTESGIITLEDVWKGIV